MTDERPPSRQVNIRLRETTIEALKQEAAKDLRTMADQADVLLMEAITARRARKGSKQ